MKHKLFRVLVALVLVCVLVVNVSPIRAEASALPEVAGVVTKVIPFNLGAGAAAGGAVLGAQVFGWVLLGLGIVATTAVTVDLMNRYSEFSGELETSIYYYPDGSWSYGVDLGFVERVRAFLFDSGVILPKSFTPNSSVTVPAEALATARAARYSFFSYSVYVSGAYAGSYGGFLLYYSNESPFKVTYGDSSGNGWYITLKDSNAVGYSYSSGHWSKFTGVASGQNTSMRLVDSILIGTDDPVEYVGADGIEVGTVAPPGVDVPTGYSEWYTNARPATNPDTDEEITVLPIPLDPNTEELPDSVIQEDVWPGSVADPLPDSGTDTDPDSGTDTDGSLANTPWEMFMKWISEGWKSIIQAIPTPDSIAEAVGNVIKSIFVPDADFITEKWNDIRSRFEFADSITATGEVLVNILDGLDPEPPVIYIDLGAAEGSYDIGGEVPFVDLRWYARYKPTMDLIISAFLWLAFVWRLLLKLPGIISGMPGEFVLMNLPVNLPHLGIGSSQRREELESGRNNRRLGDGH